MADYRKAKLLQVRINEIRRYLKDISPKLVRYKELTKELKEKLKELSSTVV